MRSLRTLTLALALAPSACKSHPVRDEFDGEVRQRGADLLAMQPPRVSILGAIATAQRAIPTGRVVGATIENGGDTPRFWTWVVDGEQLHVVRVDAWSGALLSDVRDDCNHVIVRIAAGIQSHPERVAIDFAKALDAARTAIPGAWPAAVLVHGDEGDTYTYDIELVSRVDVRNVEVHAADGTLGTIDPLGSAQAKLFTTSSADPTAADEYELTEAPSISLVAAIELAWKRAPEAMFVHAELGLDDERANCLVCLWERASLHYVEIDVETGELLVDGTNQADSELRRRLQNGAARSESSIAPARAIAASIAAVPGSWARLIDLDCNAEPLAYEVEVVAGNLVREVRIRALDGVLLSVSRPEDADSDL